MTASIRSHWNSVAMATALSHCKSLNLLPYSATNLTGLDKQMAKFVAALVFRESNDAITMEETLKRRPAWLTSRMNATMWNELKPFAKRAGEADTSLLFDV